MRRLNFMLLVIICCFLVFARAVYATPSVIVDGNILSFDVPPSIQDGRVMVPMRTIFEELGATVNWNSGTQTVTATKGSKYVSLTIGSTNANESGTSVVLDVAPEIINGRTLVPLRFVGEALGCQVNWDATSQTVSITSQVATESPTTNTQTPSAVPRLNINNVNAALTSVGLNYNEFTKTNSGASYDDTNVGVVINISLLNNQNMEITDPSENAGIMMVQIGPDNSLNQNWTASACDILSSIAGGDYSGSSSNQAASWEYQNFGTSNQSPAIMQIGSLQYMTCEIDTLDGVPVYSLYIEDQSQGSLNNSKTNQQPAPTITPDGGTFNGPVTISFSGPGRSEDIEYTTDGSDPTITSNGWNGDPITIDQSETIKVAYFEDYDSEGNAEWSKVAEATFVINSPPATQTESQPTNQQNSATTAQTAINTFYAGATSISGTAPAGAVVILTIGGKVQPAVIADANGNWIVTGLSGITSDESANVTALTNPNITPDGGTFTEPVTVAINYPATAINSDTLNYCYTTDGSNPKTSSTAETYGGPFTVDQSETILACYYDNFSATWSNVVSATFVINSAQETQPTNQQPATKSTPVTLTPPTITPDGGTFTGHVNVTISIPSGYTCLYTTDGSSPETSSSALCSGAPGVDAVLVIRQSETVQAVCCGEEWNNNIMSNIWSNVVSATCVIK